MERMRVAQLRDLCREKKLSTSGKKQELLQRLHALVPDTAQLDPVSSNKSNAEEQREHEQDEQGLHAQAQGAAAGVGLLEQREQTLLVPEDGSVERSCTGAASSRDENQNAPAPAINSTDEGRSRSGVGPQEGLAKKTQNADSEHDVEDDEDEDIMGQNSADADANDTVVVLSDSDEDVENEQLPEMKLHTATISIIKDPTTTIKDRVVAPVVDNSGFKRRKLLPPSAPVDAGLCAVTSCSAASSASSSSSSVAGLFPSAPPPTKITSAAGSGTTSTARTTSSGSGSAGGVFLLPERTAAAPASADKNMVVDCRCREAEKKEHARARQEAEFPTTQIKNAPQTGGGGVFMLDLSDQPWQRAPGGGGGGAAASTTTTSAVEMSNDLSAAVFLRRENPCPAPTSQPEEHRNVLNPVGVHLHSINSFNNNSRHIHGADEVEDLARQMERRLVQNLLASGRGAGAGGSSSWSENFSKSDFEMDEPHRHLHQQDEIAITEENDEQLGFTSILEGGWIRKVAPPCSAATQKMVASSSCTTNKIASPAGGGANHLRPKPRAFKKNQVKQYEGPKITCTEVLGSGRLEQDDHDEKDDFFGF